MRARVVKATAAHVDANVNEEGEQATLTLCRSGEKEKGDNVARVEDSKELSPGDLSHNVVPQSH